MFQRLKTIATLVNYTCKSFIELTPGLSPALMFERGKHSSSGFHPSMFSLDLEAKLTLDRVQKNPSDERFIYLAGI